MPRLIVLQHSDQCTPGRLGTHLARNGHRLDIRRLHRLGPDGVPDSLREISGVVSLGGPMGANDADEWIPAECDFLRRAHEAGLPIVGVCLGHQLLAKALGGAVAPMASGPELGFFRVSLTAQGREDPALAGVPWSAPTFCSHGDEVSETPPGAVVLSRSERCPVQGFRVGERTYAFQHHFEWTREQIIGVSESDPAFLSRAGVSIDQIEAGCDRHYSRFAEISDRRCDNLALMVFGERMPT